MYGETRVTGVLRDVCDQVPARRANGGLGRSQCPLSRHFRPAAELYPAIEDKLAELLERIAANDRQIEYINEHARPSGADRLLVAELVARVLKGFVENGVQIPRITEELRLPAFERSQFEPYAWPSGERRIVGANRPIGSRSAHRMRSRQ